MPCESSGRVQLNRLPETWKAVPGGEEPAVWNVSPSGKRSSTSAPETGLPVKVTDKLKVTTSCTWAWFSEAVFPKVRMPGGVAVAV